MDWLVRNALQPDVERQHLNKILQDIRATINTLTDRISVNEDSDAHIRTVVTQLITSGTQSGINVTYNTTSKAIDFTVKTFTIQLTGAVSGTATVTGLGNVSISTTLNEQVDGVEEAPIDGQAYWREAGTWAQVPIPLMTIDTLEPSGILVLDSDFNWYSRTLEAGDGIDIVDGDGIAGNPTVSHADTSSITDISANFTGGTVPGEISFTFDQFGHVLTRTITGRTLDHNDTGAIQGGVPGERWHFDEAEHTGLLAWATEDPADYALITQTITNGDTTHAPSGDAVFDALAGKEPTIAVGTTAQLWRGDKAWADNILGNFGVGTASPTLIGNGRELTITSAAADTLGRINLQGLRSGTTGNVASFTAFNGGTAVAQLTAGLDGATDAGSFAITTRVASGALLVRLGVSSVGVVSPGADNAQTLGSASLRWSVVYAGTGTINTSDAREKTIRGPLTATELAAAQELASAGVIYQWNDAIELKGDAARWHFGPTVQAVIAIMQSHGLDPFRYGFVCYDEWDELPEIRGEADEVVQEYRPAGDRYSLRPDQLLMFIARGQEERLRRLESLLGT